MRLSHAGAGGLCIALLVVPYLIYERDAARARSVLLGETPLRRPLAQFPLLLSGWAGTDVPLEEGVARVAGADEYLNRQYRNPHMGEAVAVYLAYYGTPRPRVGHHPEVCYPAFGWKKEKQTEEMVGEAGTAKAKGWPVSIYQFSKARERVTVVSFYISGGRLTSDRADIDSLAHESIADASRQYFLRAMLSFPGAPPTARVVQTTGRFLGRLLPALDAYLPEPLGEGFGPRQE